MKMRYQDKCHKYPKIKREKACAVYYLVIESWINEK